MFWFGIRSHFAARLRDVHEHNKKSSFAPSIELSWPSTHVSQLGKYTFTMGDENDLKRDIETAGHDFDLGPVLAVQSTPEEERKVLRKLDFV